MKVKSQLVDAQLEQRSTAPTKKSEVLFNTTDGVMQYHDGTNVQTVATTAASADVTWKSFSITAGQSATDLTGETVDSADYIAVDYDFHIVRGTTIFASGKFSLQYLNSAWRIVLGEYRSDISHGVTFSLSGTTTAQLKAAASSGDGDGTIYLRRTLLAAS